MPRSFDDIARLDRRWFRAHPERRHRCRRPETGEADLYGRDRSGRLIIAVRHLGRRVLYQPLILNGALPTDERSAAALFVLAASHSEPVPEVAALDWLQVGLLARVASRRAPALVVAGCRRQVRSDPGNLDLIRKAGSGALTGSFFTA